MLTCRVQKLRTSPTIHKLNWHHEPFNSTLLNMWGTLSPEQKKDRKSGVPSLVYTNNCIRNAATVYIPYYLLLGREARLLINVEFGLQKCGKKFSKSTDVEQYKRRPRYAHKRAKQVASKLWDTKGCMSRTAGGWTRGRRPLGLVKKNSMERETQNSEQGENEEYQVVAQPTPGVLVFKIGTLDGDKTRILHRNLLLPLQGRLRQKGGLEWEDTLDPDVEDEEITVVSGVPM